jgi:hypothetical protein
MIKSSPNKQNAINPEKAFRVITRSAGEFRTVVNKALNWGFDWVDENADTTRAYAVIFYPGDKMIIRRQISKYCPNTDKVAYSGVKAYSFDYFQNSNLRYKKRGKRNEPSYPVRGICLTTNEVFEFTGANKAVEFLKERGYKKALRWGIYQAITRNNGRYSAYGFKWERMDQEVLIEEE